jgi:hypothetical protein
MPYHAIRTPYDEYALCPHHAPYIYGCPCSPAYVRLSLQTDIVIIGSL